MKEKILTAFLVVTIASVMACNQQQKTTSETAGSDTTEMKVMIPQSDCFVWTTGRDSVWLKVEKFPNVVTGTLKYQWAEKDKNEGTLEGKMVGNRLIADYAFTSEGKQSVRQVAFLLEGVTATEGYGEMEERDGKLVFKDTSQIDFSKGMKMTGISCVDNDEKFRIQTSAPGVITDGSESFFAYKWMLQEMNGKDIGARDNLPFLQFSPGQISTVSGSTGCNTITGTFELMDDKQIIFSPLASTRKFCEDVPDEQTFIDLVQTSDHWRFENNLLILSKDGKDRLKFRPGG